MRGARRAGVLPQGQGRPQRQLSREAVLHIRRGVEQTWWWEFCALKYGVGFHCVRQAHLGITYADVVEREQRGPVQVRWPKRHTTLGARWDLYGGR